MNISSISPISGIITHNRLNQSTFLQAINKNTSLGSLDTDALSYLFNVPSFSIKPVIQPPSSVANRASFSYHEPLSSFFWTRNLAKEIHTRIANENQNNHVKFDDNVIPPQPNHQSNPNPDPPPFNPRNSAYTKQTNNNQQIDNRPPQQPQTFYGRYSPPSLPPPPPPPPPPPLHSPPTLPPGPPYRLNEDHSDEENDVNNGMKVEPKPLHKARQEVYSVIEQMETTGDEEDPPNFGTTDFRDNEIPDTKVKHDRDGLEKEFELVNVLSTPPTPRPTEVPIKYRFFPIPNHKLGQQPDPKLTHESIVRPREQQSSHDMQTLAIPVKDIGPDYITVPVAVETDHDKILTPDDIRNIEREVLNTIPDSLESFAHDVPESMFKNAMPLIPNSGPNGPRLALMEYPGPKGPMTYLITGKRKSFKIGNKKIVLAKQQYLNSLNLNSNNLSNNNIVNHPPRNGINNNHNNGNRSNLRNRGNFRRGNFFGRRGRRPSSMSRNRSASNNYRMKFLGIDPKNRDRDRMRNRIRNSHG